jgi:hypothetical protein
MAGLLSAAVFYVDTEQNEAGIDFDGVSHKRKLPLNPTQARYFFENFNIQPKNDIYSDSIHAKSAFVVTKR